MIQIRTAVLHNGVDSSVEYANKLAEQITDECVVANVYTEEPLKNVLPVRAVPNVMVCLFCEGLEEYQETIDIINQLNYIKSQPEIETELAQNAEALNILGVETETVETEVIEDETV